MKIVAASMMAATVMGSAMVDLSSPDIPVDAKFKLFKQTFNKDYADEDMMRFKVFALNDEMIQKHNAQGKSWTMGHNEFSDMTWEEFRESRVNGMKQNTFREYNYQTEEMLSIEIADSKDWIAEGAVTPVKDQGQCGSCWAFSTIGAFEGGYAIANKDLVSFSEQNLVSCDKVDSGCNGGLMDNGFEFIKESSVCLEKDYPYTSGGGNTGTCKKSCDPAATLDNYVDVKNEDGMLPALNVGPVAIAVEADRQAWQFYSGGVLDDSSCGQSLDHGVLATGYGTDGGKDYYNVKNSWGGSWGEKGYIRLVRGKSQCGIASQPGTASYPTGVKPVAPPAPTPPTPAPAPTPEPAPTPAGDCHAKLVELCGDTTSDFFACGICLIQYVYELDAAGCTTQEEEEFCGIIDDLSFGEFTKLGLKTKQ